MRIRKLEHSVYQVQYHIVWGTKYRRKLLKRYVKPELIKSFMKVQRQHPAWYINQVNTGDDHVHLRIKIPPKDRICDVVRELKSRSSAHLRGKFKYIDRVYKKSGMWSVGYFVSTIGLNEEQIKKYISKQSSWDRGEDLSQEFS